MSDIAIKKIKLFEDSDDNLLQRIVDKAYPVGSLFWTNKSAENGGNPNEIIGGTWERVKGCFVYNAKDTDTINSIDGVKEVTLSTSNLPKHTHGLQSHSHSISGGISRAEGGIQIDDPIGDGGSPYPYGIYSYAGIYNVNQPRNYCIYLYDTGYNLSSDKSLDFAHNHPNSLAIDPSYDNSGDGNFANESFSIMPPHINRYCWRRIA